MHPLSHLITYHVLVLLVVSGIKFQMARDPELNLGNHSTKFSTGRQYELVLPDLRAGLPVVSNLRTVRVL